jgi:adenylate kinase family enzyme
MKILVTGNAGSGKSTLGKKLSQKLDLPLYGLDRVVWKENWIPTPREERQRLIKEITDKESWLIEGVSKLALDEAEEIYFLDIPTYRCIFNIVKRFVKNGFGTRKELPKNCPEYLGVFKAIKMALIFKKVTRPWLLEEVTNGKVQRITHYNNLKGIL